MARIHHQHSSLHNERTVYEVRRLRKPGARGVERSPEVEEFGGLDRARLAALGYALDGCWGEASFTGIIEIHRVFYIGEAPARTALVDVLDERVAFRLLNEIELPRAGQLSISVDQFQGDVNRLARLGV